MDRQVVRDWLRSVLTPYVNPDRTFADVITVLDVFPSLAPRTELYISNVGQTSLLLQLKGTIPIQFRGATYNIPVEVWVEKGYPREPPIGYVTPTKDMLVRKTNDVGLDGLVEGKYQKDWSRKWESKSLLDFMRSLQDVFAQQPPVYAKPKSPNPEASMASPVSRPNDAPATAGPSRQASVSNGSAFSTNTPIPGQKPPPPLPGQIRPLAQPQRPPDGPPSRPPKPGAQPVEFGYDRSQPPPAPFPPNPLRSGSGSYGPSSQAQGPFHPTPVQTHDRRQESAPQWRSSTGFADQTSFPPGQMPPGQQSQRSGSGVWSSSQASGQPPPQGDSGSSRGFQSTSSAPLSPRHPAQMPQQYYQHPQHPQHLPPHLAHGQYGPQQTASPISSPQQLQRPQFSDNPSSQPPSRAVSMSLSSDQQGPYGAPSQQRGSWSQAPAPIPGSRPAAYGPGQASNHNGRAVTGSPAPMAPEKQQIAAPDFLDSLAHDESLAAARDGSSGLGRDNIQNGIGNHYQPSSSNAPPVNAAPAPPRPLNPELLALHTALHSKLAARVAQLRSTLQSSNQHLHVLQTDLDSGPATIEDEKSRLRAVRDVCRSRCERVESSLSALNHSVDQLSSRPDPSPSELVLADSIAGDQLLTLTAQELAIRDTLYHLGRAMETTDGIMELERYMKWVRSLSREAFLKRATAEKIWRGMESH